MSEVFRVLSIDGGGMRGIYSANFLRTLAHRFGHDGTYDIGKKFNLIVGTSTGGILAIALAAKVHLDDIIKMYSDKGAGIFPNPYPKSVAGIKDFKNAYLWLKRGNKSRVVGQRQLKACLDGILGEMTVEDLYAHRGISICVPSINARTYKPHVFKTPHLTGKTSDNKCKLVDLCMATSSAPLVFPLYKSPDPNDNIEQFFVDGGLCVNNPAIMAYIEAKLILRQNKQEHKKIQIFSLGTCDNGCGEIVNDKNHNRGVLGWMGGMKIANMAMTSQSMLYTDMLRFLCTFDDKSEFINLKEFQSFPSAEEAKHVGLDCATQEAISTLQTLSKKDGECVHGKCITENGYQYEAIKNLFN